ncbi:hypothetical protein V490_02911 [Pseudogymnoascus sp. VKM F-3557]|nr:hypothetical protein V490_02911 [Pseudogymnoascus sp. VKM F-3557]
MSTNPYRHEKPTKVPDEAQVQHTGNKAREPQLEQAADQAQVSQAAHHPTRPPWTLPPPPRINHIIKGPVKIMQINESLISAIELGTRHLREPHDSTTLAEHPHAEDPDADVEDLLLHPLDVSSLRFPTINSITTLLTRLRRINLALLRRPAPPAPGGPSVFYRVTTPETHTSHDPRLGIWSARGLPDHDFNEPSEDDFTDHVTGRKLKSPYISLRSDPGLASQRGNKRSGKLLVYEIDAEKMRQMGVCVEATTDLARRWGITWRGFSFWTCDYIASDKWLARFWIPVECVRVHSYEEFRDKCIEAGFIDAETHNAVKRKEVPANAHEKLASLLKPRDVPQESVVESGEEVAVSAVPRSNPPDDDEEGGENAAPIQPPPPATYPTLLQSIRNLSLSNDT